MIKKYRCGWWTWELLLITAIDNEDGYTLYEILEQYYPIKAQLFGVDKTDLESTVREYNKKNKFIKYKINNNYIERID